jgi:hypothetical protein
VKLRFTNPVAPPIHTIEQFIQHIRGEIRTLTNLDENSALTSAPSRNAPNRPIITLALNGLCVQLNDFAGLTLSDSDDSGYTLELESIDLSTSQITLKSLEGIACDIDVSGQLVHPTITFFEQNGATTGGALTGFRSASLTLAFPKQFDRLISSLLPEIVLKQTGVSIRDIGFRSEPALDCLNLFLTASVKAFVMNASGRASASLVREQNKLFIRDLQAHTDAAMLSSLLAGYVKSFASQIGKNPLPLSLGGIQLRCTALGQVSEHSVRVSFEAP